MSEKKESLKDVKIKLIPRHHHDGALYSQYDMMDKLVNKYHKEIRKAKIGLAWRKKYKPDKDGHLTLGMCHRTSDLEKELRHFDFIILLNKEVWNDPKFGTKRQKALLDHELCHAAAVYNKGSKHKKDSRGRRLFRIRHHDIEEFREIVERHGIWKRDLELFAEALLRKRRR